METRSRIQWLKQGDKNTKFFHRIANANRRFNSIDQLNVDGIEINNPNNIKQAVQSFYKELYKETEQ